MILIFGALSKAYSNEGGLFRVCHVIDLFFFFVSLAAYLAVLATNFSDPENCQNEGTVH